MALKQKRKKKGNTQKNLARVRSIFPSMDSVVSFNNDNPGILKPLLKSLKEKNIIEEDTREVLEELIRSDPMGTDDTEDFYEDSFERLTF